ncbi:unnamed protein product [Rhizoctonia solani]|uniref:Tyrosine kinase catalytic domain protein n=1 Tax=Rhizoctonia solani TaxID=456999 RepID=A0A8H3GPZ9_9AGAM|nr:unnamed protein product [Rhizoctonia solani]
MWAGAAASRLVVTTTVEWTGRSFIKSIVENFAIDGQKQYYIDLEKAMRSYIATHRAEFIPDSTNSTESYMRFTSEALLQSVSTGLTSHAPETSHYPDPTMDSLQSDLPQYTASVMYKHLIRHGCADLMPLIDPLGFSSSAVAEGGFGDVWTGNFHGDRRKLAVKVLRFSSLSGDNAKKELKRITREIYNWSKLDHENVHKLMGVTIFRERLGMVSDWMEHGNLRQYLTQNSEVDRHELCVQIARGVTYIHGVNMVHGDLKAYNILVSSTGVLKITDFDYSIFPECSLAFSATTRMGGGTLRWMASAPELLLEEEPPERGMKTDIYALGMTFLETMTNAHPYAECRDNQIYRRLARQEHPKRPEEHFSNAVWGAQMWNLLLQCWNFDPALRPAADQILASLLGIQSRMIDAL